MDEREFFAVPILPLPKYVLNFQVQLPFFFIIFAFHPKALTRLFVVDVDVVATT